MNIYVFIISFVLLPLSSLSSLSSVLFPSVAHKTLDKQPPFTLCNFPGVMVVVVVVDIVVVVAAFVVVLGIQKYVFME